MYFHVGASDYGTSRWCNSHKVSKHRACMFVQMHGVARSTVDFSKWWIGISVFCPFYSQGLRIRFGSLAVCANSRSDLRHLDFSVMINWNGSMMSCIWMARCMASFLGQKLLESFVLPSRYDSWTLAYWKSLRRDDASPAFRVLSGSVNEWVEVHWSNCYRRELLAYFQDLVGCIWERNIEAFPVLFWMTAVQFERQEISKNKLPVALNAWIFGLGIQPNCPSWDLVVYTTEIRGGSTLVVYCFYFFWHFSQHLQFAAFETKSN